MQVLRDPRSLMIALLMPFVQMLLLGYGVSLDIKHVPLCTWDREGSQRSEALLKGFAAIAIFCHRQDRQRLSHTGARHRQRRLPHRYRHSSGFFVAPQ